jgi:hypothetical protein
VLLLAQLFTLGWSRCLVSLGSNRLALDQLRDIVQDAHLNFLVGAGASSELFETLGDIEDMLTVIEKNPTEDDVQLRARASMYAAFFDAVLVKNEALVAGDVAAESVVAAYGHFLATLNRVLLRRRSAIIDKQVNVFTTNVDLAIEVAAEKLRIELNDGFLGRFAPRFSTSTFGTVVSRRSLQYDNLSEIPTFNLMKLHGSVAWRTEPAAVGAAAEIRFDYELQGVREIGQALDAVRSRLLPVTKKTKVMDLLLEPLPADWQGGLDEFVEAYEALPIVNPTKEKFRRTVLNQNYYDLLRILSNDLEKENTVLFVLGFSCRDEHIRDLLVRAARTNPTLQIFIFAYRRESVAELESQFDGSELTNSNIRVIGPAEDDDEDVKYTLRTVTDVYFEPLVPKAARRPDAVVDVNVAVGPPLVQLNE